MSCKYETEWCRKHVHCETCEHWEGIGEITTGVNDSLIIGYDNCPPDVPTLIVARKDKFDMTILNKIQGDKAKELYNYLTNHREKCCQTCKFCMKHQYICTHPKHVGDYVQKYTVCNDWN